MKDYSYFTKKSKPKCKRTYYIDHVKIDPDQNIGGIRGNMICLFSRRFSKDPGNFCGWYGEENRVFVKIVAFCPGNADPNNVRLCRKVFRQVSIPTAMTEQHFYASDDEEAIDKFIEYLKKESLQE